MKIYENYLLNCIRFYFDADDAQRAEIEKIDKQIAQAKSEKKQKQTKFFWETYYIKCIAKTLSVYRSSVERAVKFTDGFSYAEHKEMFKKSMFDLDVKCNLLKSYKKYYLYWSYYPNSERGIKNTNTIKNAISKLVHGRLEHNK